MPDDAVGSYPRPDLDRSQQWKSLDGSWDFFPDEDGSLTPAVVRTAATAETIAVPGNWEECASRDRHDWLTTAWYRRSVDVPPSWLGERVWLTIGACFHAATIWVNDQLIGTSTSGYLPWEADITDAVGAGTADVVVRVTSPVDKRDILHGKQRSVPYDDYNGCSFTPSSGIWQSVWIEPRPPVHVAAVRLTPTENLDGIEFEIELAGVGDEAPVVIIEPESESLPSITAELDSGRARAVLAIDEPRLWSPDDPYLYYFDLSVRSSNGTDSVRVYTGLRRIETRDGRILLNGEPIYLRGVLDQGYWPRTGIAAPDEPALVRDLELAREAGFNLVRKHLKPESPLWLHHADRLGMLVWAEPASPGRLSEGSTQALAAELSAMVRRDASHPSIVIWSAYNEEWGLDWALDRDEAARDAARAGYRLLKQLDPTRLAVDSSGWNHVESDLLDWHLYDERPDRFGDRAAAVVAGEPWALRHSPSHPTKAQLAVVSDPDLLAAPLINSEYGGGWDSLDRSWNTRWQTQFLRLLSSNQGYVFTELYDIEAETVGVYTADRRAKDGGGFEQHWAHADTVIIPLLRPYAYGADAIVRPGSAFRVEVRISHTGPGTLSGDLSWEFGGKMGIAATVAVPSFAVSDSVSLVVPVEHGGRLHLALRCGEDVAARTFIDIAEQAPVGHAPSDTGWRPPDPEPLFS